MDSLANFKEEVLAIVNRNSNSEKTDCIVLTKVYSLISDILEKIESKQDVRDLQEQLETYMDENKMYLPSYQLETINNHIKQLKLCIQKNSQKKTRIVFSARKATKSIPIPTKTVTPTIPQNSVFISTPHILDSQTNVQSVVSCSEDVVKFSNISNSLFIIKDKKKSIHINTISNSIVVLREIDGSVMIHNAENCLFIVQCLQIRIHTTTKCMFSLCIPNHPVIEDCNAVYFSDLCITWKKPSEKQNLFGEVLDFKWLKQEKSPHWSILSVQQFIEKDDSIKNLFKNIPKLCDATYKE